MKTHEEILWVKTCEWWQENVLQLLTAVPFSLRADERASWLNNISTASLTHCKSDGVLNISDSLSGSLPKQNTMFEAYFWFTGREGTKYRADSSFAQWSDCDIFSFFSWNTFYCLVVVKFEMETQLWSEIVLLCVTELNRYSTTMCLLFFVCDTWNHWVAPNSWSSLCAVMKLCMVHIPRRLRFDKSIAR